MTLLEREYDYDFQSSITSRSRIALGIAERVVEGARMRRTGVGMVGRARRARRLLGSAKNAGNPSKYGVKCVFVVNEDVGAENKSKSTPLTFGPSFGIICGRCLCCALEKGCDAGVETRRKKKQVPTIQTIASPVRDRISVQVPKEYRAYSFQVILVPLAPERTVARRKSVRKRGNCIWR